MWIGMWYMWYVDYVEILLANCCVDMMTRDNYKRSEEQVEFVLVLLGTLEGWYGIGDDKTIFKFIDPHKRSVASRF